MTTHTPHTFHIPVMGLGYTIDSPLKVAKFGISSVISIIEDQLVERMREFHAKNFGEHYIEISIKELDHRAQRVKEYLNLVERMLNKQMDDLRKQVFKAGNDIVKYFEMLPDSTELKDRFLKMLALDDGNEKEMLQTSLRSEIRAGDIDVNIMTKCDRTNYAKDGTVLDAEYADAMAALRGFATSNLSSSVVFSAGMNPRLYSYCETFVDFFPNEEGVLKKKIILKVSDYRSALIQGKFLAKKGLWISEFRIESGLNCGGHAFPTEGHLLGPILNEFIENKDALKNELYEMYIKALEQKKVSIPKTPFDIKVTVQGGIGTAGENNLLLNHYKVDGTGWGSPFLLVREATNVEEETIEQLATAKQEDYFLSNASPLGMPFNNFKPCSSEAQRKERIRKNRPGSPCYKKYLAFNTEFSEIPICTASREYQHLKIKALKSQGLPEDELQHEIDKVTEKDCLCEGLGAAALVKNDMTPAHNIKAISVCPGPNLAYFSGTHSLADMISHIYGRLNLNNSLYRPNLFVNELKMYIDFLEKEIKENIEFLTAKKIKYFHSFKDNLINGISYYKRLIHELKQTNFISLEAFTTDLSKMEARIVAVSIPSI